MIFEGKHLVVATAHKKELAIAPIFQDELGVVCFPAEGLDTDSFGTFSGEVERVSAAVSTARLKCQQAASVTKGHFFVASEGSFGPHPELLFAPIAEEILLFSAPKEGLEIVVKHLSMNTNFGHLETDHISEVLYFASQHLFPSHKLILSTLGENGRVYKKDIGDEFQLTNAFSALMEIGKSIRVETDMRAMNNPTRMTEIGIAAKKLTDKILSACQKCKRPGFGISKRFSGLPCGVCGTPTSTVLKYECVCDGCGFSQFVAPDHNKSFEDPMYCQVCNP
jgi:hypothetical protein